MPTLPKRASVEAGGGGMRGGVVVVVGCDRKSSMEVAYGLG